MKDSKFKFDRLKALKYIKTLGVTNLLLLTITLQVWAHRDIAYSDSVVVGAERLDAYEQLLLKRNVAIVGNQTSMIGEVHLVDTLLAIGG